MINWLENHTLPCFFKSNFGIDCPGCGMQRAFIALLKGEFYQSLCFHPGLIPFLLTIIVLFIQLKAKHPKGGIAVMWLFIFTSSVTVIQFIVKQYLTFQA
jgi:hypothetical protein